MIVILKDKGIICDMCVTHTINTTIREYDNTIELESYCENCDIKYITVFEFNGLVLVEDTESTTIKN